MNSPEYFQELKHQLSQEDNVRFWLKGSKKLEGMHYILLTIRGEKLCAEGLLFINQSTQLHRLIHKMEGYRGAELRELKYSFRKINNKLHWVYESHDSVLD